MRERYVGELIISIIGKIQSEEYTFCSIEIRIRARKTSITQVLTRVISIE